jgi:hypothetical protein
MLPFAPMQAAGPRARQRLRPLAQALEQRALLAVSPLGPELIVSGPEDGSAYVVGHEPEVARDADGDFVVVWSGADADALGVQGQRFSASGQKAGPRFDVNTFTDNHQFDPVVAMEPAGGFVVAWHDNGQGGVYTRRYDAAGQRQGEEFRVNLATVSLPEQPVDVAAADNGNFVIAWGASDGVYVQRFDQLGRVGPELRLNATPDDLSVRPRIAMRPDGSFVVAWVKFVFSPTGWSESGGFVRAQQFDPSGNRLGDPVDVATFTNGITPENVDVGVDGAGGIVVAWDFGPRDNNFRPRGLHARRFDAAGAPLGEPIVVAEQSAPVDPSPQLGNVAVDPSGAFVVSYAMNSNQGGEVYARAYDADAVPQSVTGLLVNGRIQGRQFAPRAVTTADGGYFVAWESDRTTSGQPEVVGQRYAAVANPLSVEGITWADVDQDGLRDFGEGGIDGVRVDLFTLAGTQAASVLTSGGGRYRFDLLRPGQNYMLAFGLPRAHLRSPPYQGTGDQIDSDADSTGRTTAFLAGQVTNMNAGLIPPGVVAGVVWNDANGNGLRDPGETGRPFENVSLVTSGAQYSVSADEQGNYRFDAILAGQYQLFFRPPPAGLSYTVRDVGTDDSVDSDVDPATFQVTPVVVAPAQTARFDAGLAPLTAVRGRVYFDANANGVYDANVDQPPGNMIVFDDAHGDGHLSPGEPRVNADVRDGTYQLQVAPGPRRIGVTAASTDPVMPSEVWAAVEVPLGTVVQGVNLALVPPRVADVFVRGGGWADSFKAALEAAGLGEAAAGARVPVPGPRVNIIPWAGIDQVVVRFTVPVIISTPDVLVRGVNGASYNATLVGRLPGEANDYLFALGRPVVGDRLWVQVSGGPTGVFSRATFYRLDGNQDRQPGGDHDSRASVVPGDATGDGAVTTADYAAVRAGAGTTAGDGSYAPRLDLTADGVVGASDLALARRRLGSTLPSPTAAAIASPSRPRPRPAPRGLFGESPPIL